jgi:ketosteroid isomerase-like protein
MSEENVALVLRTFDAFNAGGFEAMLDLFPPDVVWYPAPGWVEDVVYRGYDGARKMSGVFTKNFVDLALEPCNVRAGQDRVLVLVKMTGRTRHDNVPLEQHVAMLYSDFRSDFRGEAIGEVRFFFTWEEGLQAMGSASTGDEALKAVPLEE